MIGHGETRAFHGNSTGCNHAEADRFPMQKLAIIAGAFDGVSDRVSKFSSARRPLRSCSSCATKFA